MTAKVSKVLETRRDSTTHVAGIRHRTLGRSTWPVCVGQNEK